MKKKFDLKTSKVKGICFHRTRQNWIAIGLFTGELQIWDFRNGLKISEFKESDACIRSVDFHPLQSLLVGGGDDFLIRGYDYAENKRAFELKGHVDFIRTVQFHRELPWVLSCSDDQTVRVWNWQSKSQLSVVTGHGHYVMCARFHASKDLIVSGSLDSTLRVWDFARLKSRFSSAHGAVYMLSGDVEPLVVAEAHAKGVNWVEFHPSEDLVATCSDDRLVKLWRVSPGGAVEQQAFHGHTGNVSSVAFTREGRNLVSNSEDNCLRLWDLGGLSLAKVSFGEERQWALAVHPALPLVASGGDKSLTILSLMSERVQYDAKGGLLVFYSMADRTLKSFERASGLCVNLNFPPGAPETREGGERAKAQHLLLNPFSRGAALSGLLALRLGAEKLAFAFGGAPGAALAGAALKMRRGVFVSAEKLLVLAEGGPPRQYRVPGLAPLGELSLSFEPEDLFQGALGKVFLRSGERLVYYDVLARGEVFAIEEEDFRETRRVLWNAARSLFAVLTRFGVYIFDKRGKKRAGRKEEARIKSAIWSPDGAFFYNTHEHIKYILRDGEVGLVRSIDKIVFLAFCRPGRLVVFDVNENFEELELDTSEIEFKNALAKNATEDIRKLLAERRFLGKSMPAYLLSKKYTAIALQLTKDPETAFYLALHAGNLPQAFGLARELGEPGKFALLAEEAACCGNPALAEACLQLARRPDKLLALLALAGDRRGLGQLAFGDPVRRFDKTLFTGDLRERVRVLSEAGQIPLAYATAKTYGLREYVGSLERAHPELRELGWGVGEGEARLFLPPRPVVGDKAAALRVLDSWPLKELAEETREALEDPSADEGEELQKEDFANLEGALDLQARSKKSNFDLADKIADKSQGNLAEKQIGVSPQLKVGPNANLGLSVDQNEAEDAWGVDTDFAYEALAAQDPKDDEAKIARTSNPPLGQTGAFFEEEDPLERKVKRTSVLSWEHFAIGDVEAGLKLLRSQIGLKSAAAIRKLVLEFAFSSSFSSNLGLCPNSCFQNYLMDPSRLQIHNKYNFRYFGLRYEQMMQAVSKAKIPEALELARQILLPLMVAKIASAAEAEVLELYRRRVLSYSVALRAKVQNDKEADPKKKAELCLVMAVCELEPAHKILVLQIAINALVKLENFQHALGVVRRFLKICEENPGIAKEDSVAKMRKLLVVCEQKGKNAIEFDFKEKYLYDGNILDRVDFEQLRFFGEEATGKQMVKCPFDDSAYESSAKGQVCRFCETCEIGYDAVKFKISENYGQAK